MSQISEDARKMRDYIIEHGWTQGETKNDAGNVCLVGAYTEAMHSAVIPIQMLDALVEATGVKIPVDITCWNDKRGRTQDEVLDMLENVAIKYDDDAMTIKGGNDG